MKVKFLACLTCTSLAFLGGTVVLAASASKQNNDIKTPPAAVNTLENPEAETANVADKENANYAAEKAAEVSDEKSESVFEAIDGADEKVFYTV